MKYFIFSIILFVFILCVLFVAKHSPPDVPEVQKEFMNNICDRAKATYIASVNNVKASDLKCIISTSHENGDFKDFVYSVQLRLK